MTMPRTSSTWWRGYFVATTLFTTLVTGGCSHTDQGIVGGGLLGGAIGSIVGGRKHSGAGAIIGGVTGAALGGAAGASADRQERREAAAAIAATRQTPLSIPDVIQLTSSGMSDQVIIGQIRSSGAVYHLSAQDLLTLQNSGVREPVIREMQATVGRPVRRVYVAEPVPPPPPVGVGVGVTYVHR